MQVIIDAGKWQAGYDMDSGRIGKQIEFMRGWTIDDIKIHCDTKGWKYQTIGEAQDSYISHDYGCYEE